MPGNNGGMLLVYRSSGRAITITFWNTEEDLGSSVEKASQLRQQAADSGGLSDRSVENYEVGMEFGRLGLQDPSPETSSRWRYEALAKAEG
jgi:hypothetical protein